MNKNQNQIVSLLSDAINDVIVGQDTKATQTLVSAIKLLNVTTTATPKDAVIAASKTRTATKTATRKRKRTYTRLNPEQVSDIKARLAQGEPVAAIARWYKVPYQRVYNYSYTARVAAQKNQ
jgi:hypothetical protein